MWRVINFESGPVAEGKEAYSSDGDKYGGSKSIGEGVGARGSLEGVHVVHEDVPGGTQARGPLSGADFDPVLPVAPVTATIADMASGESGKASREQSDMAARNAPTSAGSRNVALSNIQTLRSIDETSSGVVSPAAASKHVQSVSSRGVMWHAPSAGSTSNTRSAALLKSTNLAPPPRFPTTDPERQ